mmetsp:Transcript_2770/g.8254  ORF Transcript_2770/g.8254 Transcript_2770/m.8254 type:complete len:254 (-) Transcript_2770:100-861(-)
MAQVAVPVRIEEAQDAGHPVPRVGDALGDLAGGAVEVVEVLELGLQVLLRVCAPACAGLGTDARVALVEHVFTHRGGVGELPVAEEAGMRRLVDFLPQVPQEAVEIRTVLPVRHLEVEVFPHVLEGVLHVTEVPAVEQRAARGEGLRGLLLLGSALLRAPFWRCEGTLCRTSGIAGEGRSRVRRGLTASLAAWFFASLDVRGALLGFPRPGDSALLKLPLPSLLGDRLEPRQPPLGVVHVALGLAMGPLLGGA